MPFLLPAGLIDVDGLLECFDLGVSGRLVGPAVFKAVEASFARRLVGSIPIHSRGAVRPDCACFCRVCLTFPLTSAVALFIPLRFCCKPKHNLV